MENRGVKLQDLAASLLEDCVTLTSDRRKRYGGHIFEHTANVANAIFDNTHKSMYTADDVLRIMFCMKLARYGLQLSLPDELCCEKTIVDSVLDSNVYAAILEAERQIQNEEQSKKTGSPE